MTRFPVDYYCIIGMILYYWKTNFRSSSSKHVHAKLDKNILFQLAILIYVFIRRKIIKDIFFAKSVGFCFCFSKFQCHLDLIYFPLVFWKQFGESCFSVILRPLKYFNIYQSLIWLWQFGNPSDEKLNIVRLKFFVQVGKIFGNIFSCRLLVTVLNE